MRKTVFSFIVLGTLFVLSTSLSSACSCVQEPGPQEALEDATAVFAGKVTHIEDAGGIFTNGEHRERVTFTVEKTWKGPPYETLVVSTAKSSTACGYHFERGKKYLVYAQEGEDTLTTSICSRTTSFANAGEDLNALGPGGQPTTPGSNTGLISYPSRDTTIMGIVVVLVGVVALLIRKYKK